MGCMETRRSVTAIDKEAAQKRPLHQGCAVLRRAVRQNLVSFPSQIPVFLKAPPADTQWRVVLLFFVQGWSSIAIAARFNVPKHRIRHILYDWAVRALDLGYVAIIDAEGFAARCRAANEIGSGCREDRVQHGLAVQQDKPLSYAVA